MEALQMAQILADLSTLQNTEPAAAQNLLDANKNLTPNLLHRKSRASILPEQPKFDKLGRRIIRGPSQSGNVTPIGGGVGGRPELLSRMSSGFSGVSSGTATPAVVAPEEKDEDMARAKKLLELYEMRGKFQEMGDAGLARAKEKVDKVVDQYTKRDLEEREIAARARKSGF